MARYEAVGLEEVGIDAPEMPSGLDSLRAERNAQRGHEGFGALADRDVVYLGRPWKEEGDDPVVYLMEIGPDRRRVR
nr:hypothetical protein StreXyl84_79910 [Streptomyces sp. Xyl84]